MIDNIISSYRPITTEYKKQSIILYVASHNNIFYVNINSLCNTHKLTVDKWKRQITTNNLIKNSSPFKPYISDKINGTWISKTLFISFGNWIGTKIPSLNNLGTYINTHLPTLYNEQSKKYNPYFTRINNFKLRATSNNFIDLSDIATIYSKDLRSWKKTIAYKTYILTQPSHCLSTNNITDELGLRTTHGHPDIANLLVKYYNKKTKPNTQQHFIQQNIHNFISFHSNILSQNHEITQPTEKNHIIHHSQQAEISTMVLDGKKEVNDSRQEEKNPVKKLNLMNLTPEDFKDIRSTPDGLFCVYDAIFKFKKCSVKDARTYFSRTTICSSTKTHKFIKSNGCIGQPIPVAPFNQLLQILSQLPGEQAKMLRKEQAEITTRVIAGDEDIEEAVRDQRVKVSEQDRDVLMSGLERQEKKFGLDTLPYERKDVVYTLEFKPNKSVNNVDCENDNAEDEDRKYYKFGVASDISARLKQHESDKDFEKVRLDRCFTYNCGYDMSKGEKKIKRILDSMNIRIQYGKKKECFVATTEELKSVYEEMDRYNKVSIYSTIENIKGKEGDDKIEIEKIRINKEKHDKYLDMFERDKITFEQLEKLILTLKG